MDQSNNRIKIGLVLSGGIAKGAYQIGFCNALKNHSVFDINVISSASIGTLNGYALSANKLETAEDFWKNINIRGYKQILKKLFQRKEIFDIIDSNCLTDDELNIPLYTVLWSPVGVKPSYFLLNDFNYETRLQYLKASISFLPVMKPVVINNVKYYDGAIIDNTPLTPLLKYNLDLIIVIQFDGYVPKYKPNEVTCPIIFLNLQDNCSLTDSFHFEKTEVMRMINFGYDIGDNLLSLIEKSYHDRERFLELITYYNSKLKENPISGDYLVRRINRMSKLL